jgi:hypothetical protein
VELDCRTVAEDLLAGRVTLSSFPSWFNYRHGFRRFLYVDTGRLVDLQRDEATGEISELTSHDLAILDEHLKPGTTIRADYVHPISDLPAPLRLRARQILTAGESVLDVLARDPRQCIRLYDTLLLRAGGPWGYQLINTARRTDWLSLESIARARELLASAGKSELEPIDADLARRVDAANEVAARAMERMQRGDGLYYEYNFLLAIGERFYCAGVRDGVAYNAREWARANVEKELYALVCPDEELRFQPMSDSIREAVLKFTDLGEILADVRAGRASIGGGIMDTTWSLSRHPDGRYIARRKDSGYESEEVLTDADVEQIVLNKAYWVRRS